MAEGEPIDLPGFLADLAEAIGVAAALRFAHDFGGGEVYIPRRMPPDHKIVHSVGLPAAIKIAKRFGGAPYLIPLGPTSDGRRVASAIDKALRDGKPAARVAREIHCHVRTVHRRRRKLGIRDDHGQADLFE